jgi:hypothetical protein
MEEDVYDNDVYLIFAKSNAILEKSECSFLEFAEVLREAQDLGPDYFVAIAKLLKVGLRKAYVLAKIDRHFGQAGFSRDRLRKIGWTKLSLLASAGAVENLAELLKFAEACTAYELKLRLAGEEIDPDGRCVVLYLSSGQYSVFEAAILKHGALKVGKSLLGKENAVAKALSKSL